MGELRVLEPGFLTTIQDARGRPGLGRFGIPPGGAADAAAARLANRLVGNGGDEAVLEATLQGPTLEWMTAGHIGLAGADLGATAGGLEMPPGHSYRLAPGSTLEFGGPRTGARGYLAVEGGFALQPVLGSFATDVRSRFGGLDGRALRAGDVVPFASGQDGPLRFAAGAAAVTDPVLSFIPCPRRFGWFAPSAVRVFCDVEWTVAPDSDRLGIRLAGAVIPSTTTGIASFGVPVGAVQVPPSGAPIIKLVDGPVTGGYPVLGVIPRAEHARLAQAAPGMNLRFGRASVTAVRRQARRSQERERIELDDGEFAAGWAR
jgi:biotin-dependent carboxylase-like uncharacterized protein